MFRSVARFDRWRVGVAWGLLAGAIVYAGSVASSRVWADPALPTSTPPAVVAPPPTVAPAAVEKGIKYERQIAQAVAKALREGHLSKHPLDDEISRRLFVTFLKLLDPMKVYFLQADVDEFSKSE